MGLATRRPSDPRLRDGYRFVPLEFGVRAAWMGGSIPKDALLPTVDLAAGPAVPIALLVLALAALVPGARRALPRASI